MTADLSTTGQIKIRVQRSDERIETLTLRGDWRVVSGVFLNRVTTEPFGPRLDHYFTKDGFYDGWGGAVTCGPKEGHAIIEAMEAKRDIDE